VGSPGEAFLTSPDPGQIGGREGQEREREEPADRDIEFIFVRPAFQRAVVVVVACDINDN
jgi:hypothetical protein